MAPDFPIKTAAERILWAKTINAGQICTAVDYAFLPRGAETEFVDHCRRLFGRRYPDINGPDFTSIIDDRSYGRLKAALEDARAKGATLINLAEGQTPDASKRKFSPHLALNPTADMEIMRREISARFCRSASMTSHRKWSTPSTQATGRWRSILSPTMRRPASFIFHG